MVKARTCEVEASLAPFDLELWNDDWQQIFE